MESTFPEALLAEALGTDRERALAASRKFFTSVVEPLADRFGPPECEMYAALFGRILREVFPELRAVDLEDRYRRIRQVRAVSHEPQIVVVPSRVTLGADVAVTSVVLDGAKRRFPNSQVLFAGPAKNLELFAADPQLTRYEIPYPRIGTLRDRLAVWEPLRKLSNQPGVLVLDPDSRLSQLGMLPLGEEQNYHLFESRSYGGNSRDTLVQLTERWISETLGVSSTRPYIAPAHSADEYATTVSFGVGENLEKRVGEAVEREILKHLPRPILIDRGAGGEEGARVDRAIRDSGVPVQSFNGPFAGFAAHIARSKLYVGYDSAGGHVAAACQIPMVSLFAGFVSERMFERWKPFGFGPIRVINANAPDFLPMALAAIEELRRERQA